MGKTNTKSVISLVLGIVGVFFCWSFVGILLGIPGLIVGIMGKNEIDRDPDQNEMNNRSNRNLAVAGIVTSIIALVIGLIATVITVWVLFLVVKPPFVIRPNFNFS